MDSFKRYIKEYGIPEWYGASLQKRKREQSPMYLLYEGTINLRRTTLGEDLSLTKISTTLTIIHKKKAAKKKKRDYY